MTLQSLCICVEIFIGAIAYVYMQFFSVPEFIVLVAQICLILMHGKHRVVKIDDTPVPLDSTSALGVDISEVMLNP